MKNDHHLLTSTAGADQHQPAMLACGPDQAAKAIGISRGRLYQLLAAGELPSMTVGKRRLIRVCDIESFLARGVAASADARIATEKV